jgi:hypothetical protein
MFSGFVKRFVLAGVVLLMMATAPPAIAQAVKEQQPDPKPLLPSLLPSVLPGVLPNVVLPNVVLPGVKLPIVSIIDGRPVIKLPDLPLPNLSLVHIAGLPIDLHLGGDTLLVLSLPGISIALPNLSGVGALGSGVVGIVLDQVSAVTQSLAGTSNSAALGPIQALIDGVGSGGAPSSNSAAMGGSGFAPLPLVNMWMWNSVTFGTSSHGGYQFRGGEGDGAVSGSTLATRSNDWAEMPGVLWDASTVAGLRPGTLHIGLNAGIAETELSVKGNSVLRELGITQAGKANLRSWSAGGFALLTTRSWYTGAAAGGSWGKADTDNYITGAGSEFNGTSFTSALFLGTVMPVWDVVKLDLRGMLGYQRTVGDGHSDSIGIVYGDHTIENFNGTLSARLFGSFDVGGTILRPYVQAGVTHRFHYANELKIQGIDFSFDDADTSVFAAGGIDLDISQKVQFSVGVRHEHSPDFDNLVGRIGFIYKLN